MADFQFVPPNPQQSTQPKSPAPFVFVKSNPQQSTQQAIGGAGVATRRRRRSGGGTRIAPPTTVATTAGAGTQEGVKALPQSVTAQEVSKQTGISAQSLANQERGGYRFTRQGEYYFRTNTQTGGFETVGSSSAERSRRSRLIGGDGTASDLYGSFTARTGRSAEGNTNPYDFANVAQSTKQAVTNAKIKYGGREGITKFGAMSATDTQESRDFRQAQITTENTRINTISLNEYNAQRLRRERLMNPTNKFTSALTTGFKLGKETAYEVGDWFRTTEALGRRTDSDFVRQTETQAQQRQTNLGISPTVSGANLKLGFAFVASTPVTQLVGVELAIGTVSPEFAKQYQFEQLLPSQKKEILGNAKTIRKVYGESLAGQYAGEEKFNVLGIPLPKNIADLPLVNSITRLSDTGSTRNVLSGTRSVLQNREKNIREYAISQGLSMDVATFLVNQNRAADYGTDFGIVPISSASNRISAKASEFLVQKSLSSAERKALARGEQVVTGEILGSAKFGSKITGSALVKSSFIAGTSGGYIPAALAGGGENLLQSIQSSNTKFQPLNPKSLTGDVIIGSISSGSVSASLNRLGVLATTGSSKGTRLAAKRASALTYVAASALSLEEPFGDKISSVLRTSRRTPIFSFSSRGGEIIVRRGISSTENINGKGRKSVSFAQAYASSLSSTGTETNNRALLDTISNTNTQSNTYVGTLTNSLTNTNTNTNTNTRTNTLTQTESLTDTLTGTQTNTATNTNTFQNFFAPDFSGIMGGGSSNGSNGGGKNKFKYSADAYSAFLGIKGKSRKGSFSGLETRGIVESKKKTNVDKAWFSSKGAKQSKTYRKAWLGR